MATEPLISVIIPVYNVSAYLDACVNSVTGQTYKNLEIILVDDGSPDDCPKKCDDYAARDSRIKVIHQKNGGLSAARNAALDICQGEYISFIDSDDAVADDYIYALYKILNDNWVEISICTYQEFSAEIPVNRSSSWDSTIFNAHDAVRILFTSGPFTTSAWGKLYHRRLFQTLRFPKEIIYEDLPTIWQAFAQVDKVAFSPVAQYYYRQNPDSITRTRFTHKNLDHIKAHRMVLDELASFFPDLAGIVRGRLGYYATIYLYCGLKSSFFDYAVLKMLQQNTKKHLVPLLNHECPARIKLFALFLSNNFIFMLFCKWSNRNKTINS